MVDCQNPTPAEPEARPVKGSPLDRPGAPVAHASAISPQPWLWIRRATKICDSDSHRLRCDDQGSSLRPDLRPAGPAKLHAAILPTVCEAQAPLVIAKCETAEPTSIAGRTPIGAVSQVVRLASLPFEP